MSADDRVTISDTDIYLFAEGTHSRLYDRLGAKPTVEGGATGVRFSVWAPNARQVAVIGDFNGWEHHENPLEAVQSSGIWSGFVPGVEPGARYKFYIHSQAGDYRVEKADPFAYFGEVPPKTASRVWELDYQWGDQEWMETRGKHQSLGSPISIYEVHAGSWRRNVDEGFRSLTYRELADELIDYVAEQGFTHIEFLPLTEHPFYGSWGYQVTSYFAPTARHGEPQELMYLIDRAHQKGIGVILDWVPAHFPTDEHGLGFFDGTHLFEHADPRQGFHPDWNTYIYNYGRKEVRSFLLSSAVFWLDKYHVDALRVDGVASMIYLDYSREHGDWVPNDFGGRENIDAISFLRQFNETVYSEFPTAHTIAEESTAWPGVSRPTYLGGLGFGMKWDMGWMHDTLSFFQKEPVHRKFHQDQLTFRAIYAFHENFVLSLSHDEVVHGKGSLLDRMPGDGWQKFANLRLLYSYMFALPGKKLLFMGQEFGQGHEWNHDDSLHWSLLGAEPHLNLQTMVRELNHLYRTMPALHELDVDGAGFEWIDTNDRDNSVLIFMRKAKNPNDQLICVLNMTPIPRENYRVGVGIDGYWREVFNSDRPEYGGSGVCNPEPVEAGPVPWHGRTFSLNLQLPPLAAMVVGPCESPS